MAASARNSIACFALLVSILALHLPSCVDQRGTTSWGGGTTTKAAVTASASASASAPPPGLFDNGALKTTAILALAGMDTLFIAAAVIYSRQTHHAAIGAGGGGTWRISELAFFVLCLQVGVLQFVLFVQQPAAAGDDAARALGICAAAHALPFVASVTFFLGINLIYSHVGNAGGGAAGGAVVAVNGPVPEPAAIKLLDRMTLAAALACLMNTILALFYINTK